MTLNYEQHKTIGDYATEQNTNYPVNWHNNHVTLWRVGRGDGDDTIEIWLDEDSCIASLPPRFPTYAFFHLLSAFNRGFEWGQRKGRTETQQAIKSALGL